MVHFQEKDRLIQEKLVQPFHRNWKGVGSECPDSWYCGILYVSSGGLPRGLALFAPQLDARLVWSQQGFPFAINLVLAMQNLRSHVVKAKQVHIQNHGVVSIPRGR